MFRGVWVVAVVASAACGSKTTADGVADPTTAESDGTSGDTATDSGAAITAESTSESGMATVHLSLEDVPMLNGATHTYEAWLAFDAADDLSLGRFNVSASGVLSQSEFEIASDLLDLAVRVQITLEPIISDAPTPSEHVVMAGTLMQDSAAMSPGHPSAMNTMFGQFSAQGTYILETPTTSDASDYRNGIWWLCPADATSAVCEVADTGMPPATSDSGHVGDQPTPGLLLGSLDGVPWTYEGWIRNEATLEWISTGRFSDPVGADHDGAGASAGTEPAPAFPGQDFVGESAIDLTAGYTAWISVEPSGADTDVDTPFLLILADDLIEDAGAGVPQDMRNLGAAPVGIATIMR